MLPCGVVQKGKIRIGPILILPRSTTLARAGRLQRSAWRDLVAGVAGVEQLWRGVGRPGVGAKEIAMRLKVVVHEADEGGFWAEVPAISGCATEGETFEELLTNLYEAIEGCLSVDVVHVKTGAHDRVMDIAI